MDVICLYVPRHHFSLLFGRFPTPHTSPVDSHPISVLSPCLLWHVILALTCIYSSRAEAGQTSRFIPLTCVQVLFIRTPHSIVWDIYEISTVPLCRPCQPATCKDVYYCTISPGCYLDVGLSTTCWFEQMVCLVTTRQHSPDQMQIPTYDHRN